MDGIYHKRTLDSVDCTFNQQLHSSEPKLSIVAETDPGVDWMLISEAATGDPVFAIHDDGTIQTRAWQSADYEHPDTHASSVATGPDSVYIGRVKLSDKNGVLKIQRLTDAPYIPERLKHGPYDLDTRPLSEFDPNTDRTINDWMSVARSYNSGVDKKLLRIRDVFPVSNESVDFVANLNYPQKIGNKIQIISDVIKTASVEAAENSVWLGDRLHVNYDSIEKKAQLLSRKSVIPKYLIDRGVVLQDLIDIGVTVETLSLDNCRTLSDNSGGSTIISDIFPVGNRDDDFDQTTVFNEILIKSNHPGDQSGLDIANDSSHPIINLKGSTGGRGLIQFVEDGVAKGVIYSSGISNALRIESVGEKLVLEDSLELSGSDIIVKNGTSFKYENGIDIQTQINNLDNLYSTDAQRISAVNTLVTNYSAADQTLQNTLENSINAVQATCTSNTASISQVNSTPTTIWVDASRSDTYSEDGSRSLPYKTLTAAMSAKLQDGATESYVFRLLPGTYTGGVSIDHTAKTQSFKIEGSGRDVTFIESGSTFSTGKDTNVLYLRDFVSIEISDVTIRNGLYGFYPRSVDRVVCERVKFIHLGSDGTVNRHDQSASQAEQAAFWASASTSSGGACRIRDVGQLQMADCEVEYSLRGLRLQNVGSLNTSSSVTNCRTFRTLESGIYLASGSYTGLQGCINLAISGCTVCEAFNNGILVIGGQYCSVQGCTILRSANAGIQIWHSLDITVADNVLMDTNRRSYNGIGNDGDAHANIEVTGNSGIGTGTYMAILKGNTISNGGVGRAAQVIGFSIQRTGAGGAFPTESNKFVLESNVSDCVLKLSNPQSIPRSKGEFRNRIEVLEADPHITAAEQAKLASASQTELGYLSGTTSSVQNQLDTKQTNLSFGTVTETNKVVYSQDIKTYVDGQGGSTLSNPFILETDDEIVKFELKSSHATSKGEFSIFSSDETAGVHDARDMAYKFKCHDIRKMDCVAHQFFDHSSVHNNVEKPAFSINKHGNMIFWGDGQNIADYYNSGAPNMRFMGSVLLHNSHLEMANIPTANPLIANRVYNNQGVLALSSGSSDEVVRSTSHENPGGYTNWLELPYNCTVLSIEQAQTARRRLPLNPKPGHEIKILFPLGSGTLNIHTGAHQNDGVYRTFFSKSTGFASQYQVNITSSSAGDIFTCIYIQAVNKWYLK